MKAWESDMHYSRRAVLKMAAGVVVLPATARLAGAQTYPSRSLRIVVGVAAGSGWSLYHFRALGRSVARIMS